MAARDEAVDGLGLAPGRSKNVHALSAQIGAMTGHVDPSTSLWIAVLRSRDEAQQGEPPLSSA